MLWQKRQVTPADGTGAMVDLRTLAGFPGRLLFAESFTGNRMTDVPCIVRKVDRSEIVIELQHTGAIPQSESAVILEVANQTALLQCFTTVRSRAKGAELILRTPQRPHIVQLRRFPRIDLFVGITITTNERSINPLAAQMTNMSVDGAACVLVEPLTPGHDVTLNLTVIGLGLPEIKATVLRCTATPSHLWVVGLQFRLLTPEQEAYLGTYISGFLERQETPS